MPMFKPIKAVQSQINNSSTRLAGQLIYTSDTKKLYVDDEFGNRNQITDVIEVFDDYARSSLGATAITNKFYFVQTTNKLWRCTSSLQWVCLNPDDVRPLPTMLLDHETGAWATDIYTNASPKRILIVGDANYTIYLSYRTPVVQNTYVELVHLGTGTVTVDRYGSSVCLNESLPCSIPCNSTTVIHLESGIDETNNTWSIVKSGSGEITEDTVAAWGFTKATGTYSKPSGGIPKSDLEITVQTSLGKADSALQQHQTLDHKQNTITATGILKGTGAGVAAATPNVDYAEPYSPAAVITASTTLDASHWGQYLPINSANAVTITLPTAADKTEVSLHNIGVGDVSVSGTLRVGGTTGAAVITLATDDAVTLKYISALSAWTVIGSFTVS